MRASLLPVVVLLASSMLWGLTWLPMKHFGDFGIEGPLVTLGAHGSVGLLAVPFLFLQRRGWSRGWSSLALLAFCGGLANLAFATAMVRGDVTRVMVLFYLLPAWGVVLARMFLDERVDAKRALSLVFALGGAFFVLGGPQVLVAPPSWIDALAALSGLALACNNVVFRKAQHLTLAHKVAAVFVGSLLWAASSQWILAPTAEVTATPVIWAEVVAFGGWILLATAGTLYGVNHLEAGRSSVLVIMELVTAVVSAAIIMKEVPTASACAGGILILVAALLEAIRREPALEGENS